MKQRALKYDIIRIVAVSMVLFVHVTVLPVVRYQGITFTVGNLFNSLSRAGVPMFLLLTGALLLNEERPFDAKRFYRTSFLSIALLLLFGWCSTPPGGPSACRCCEARAPTPATSGSIC